MCGIAGFNFSEQERINPAELSQNLFLEIIKRGRDATGIAYLDNADNKFRVRKAAIPATKFFPALKEMPADVTNAILHTRWATKGSPENSKNNHPIIQGKVVGVHNGHLSNDDALFRHLSSVERRGQVDSEAAFALLGNTRHHPTDVLGTLEGRAALAWLDVRDRIALHLARCEQSPLAIGQTRHGSLIFASTIDHLHKACLYTNVKLAWADELDEGMYLKIKNGVIHEWLDINEPIKQVA
jgi:glucosamine 6-phosphate synthetase-like amidotransferase/phosphosugar isomerase protein